MIIVSKERDTIGNVPNEQEWMLFIGSDNKLKVVSGGNRTINLGGYGTYQECLAVVDMIKRALATNTTVFEMPTDEDLEREMRGRYSDHTNKFAGNGKKPVRRGGS